MAAINKNFLEAIQAELRSLSTEARRQFPELKEAAESGIMSVRNVANILGK